jgi:glucosamine 6-phosphate synthetase-like amidotransferase/phosphosugar isomerase protein
MEETLGIEVTAAAPTLLGRVYGKPMMVYVSQGGSSTNTLAAMEAARAWPGIALTGYAEGEMQKRAEHRMLIGCGPEDAGPKTKGYTCTVFCLYCCALEAALAAGDLTRERYENGIETLRRLCANMPRNLDACERWLDHNLAALSQTEKMVLVGRRGGADAAREGALKLLETIKAPAIAFEFEEYLHGPIMLTDETLTGLFFISPDKTERPRMEELAACHARFSPRVFRVLPGDTAETDGSSLTLAATGEPHTLVLEFVLPVQWMAARLPGAMGIPEGSAVYDDYAARCPTKHNNGC